MTKKDWSEKIRQACKDAGTYQPFFELVIEQLASIMETKDTAEEAYKTTNNQPVLAYTNKGGHTNLRKNPALAVIQECNQQALAYWRDLGLTPSGFKKLDGTVVKIERDSFSELLADIGL